MYSIHHWDTFDNETSKVTERRTLEEARNFVYARYAGRIGSNGADQVDIVKDGEVVQSFKVS